MIKRRVHVKRRDGHRQHYWRVVWKKGKLHRTRPGPEVIKLAHKVENELKPLSKKTVIAGSIRRKVEAPVDIDIVVIPKDKKRIRQRLSELGRVQAAGEQTIQTKIKGVDTDVYFAKPENLGAQLLTRTGSAGHNIGLRRIAMAQGKKLNEYGLFDKKTGRRIAGRTERSIYKALDRPKFRQPEERK